ncbi:hypothetical protein AMECASPLE_004564 [Ameca splendens]|uniref:Uncharacterized protein n=1 Tax=Ameca splendens TaxID=208324 RepID=A0ABV0XBX6_9TELE
MFCAHNGTPNPTPRWDKLTRQGVPGQQQAPGAAVPHHAPCNHTNTPQHHHYNDSPGRNIIQLSSTITAQPIQMPVTPHPRRGHNHPTRCSPFMPPSSHPHTDLPFGHDNPASTSSPSP